MLVDENFTKINMLFALCIVFNLAYFSCCMPLSHHIVDLTYVFDETTLHYPGTNGFKIDMQFNGTIEAFGDLWVQYEEYSSATHVGTHMDAPSHFIKGGITIDEIPVSQFIGPAAVIDITAKAELDPDTDATLEDLHNWEIGTGQSLDSTIILLRTGWGKKWHNRTAFFGTPENDASKLHFPGISPEACQWLVDHRSVKGIGSDTLSIDNGPARHVPSHQIVLRHGLFILENVANMEQLPLYGAKLYALPMKIGKGSGAPTRVIATIPKIIYSLPSMA